MDDDDLKKTNVEQLAELLPGLSDGQLYSLAESVGELATRCEGCRDYFVLSLLAVSHIKPISEARGHTLSNIMMLCETCQRFLRSSDGVCS